MTFVDMLVWQQVRNGQENLKREMRCIKKVKHQNVIQLIENIDEPENDKVYLVFELANLFSLQDLCEHARDSGVPNPITNVLEKQLPIPYIKILFVQLIAGLQACHSKASFPALHPRCFLLCFQPLGCALAHCSHTQTARKCESLKMSIRIHFKKPHTHTHTHAHTHARICTHTHTYIHTHKHTHTHTHTHTPAGPKRRGHPQTDESWASAAQGLSRNTPLFSFRV